MMIWLKMRDSITRKQEDLYTEVTRWGFQNQGEDVSPCVPHVHTCLGNFLTPFDHMFMIWGSIMDFETNIDMVRRQLGSRAWADFFLLHCPKP